MAKRKAKNNAYLIIFGGKWRVLEQIFFAIWDIRIAIYCGKLLYESICYLRISAASMLPEPCFIGNACNEMKLYWDKWFVGYDKNKKWDIEGEGRSKGKGRVLRQYFERTGAVRLLIHSLETRCFRRVSPMGHCSWSSDSQLASAAQLSKSIAHLLYLSNAEELIY